MKDSYIYENSVIVDKKKTCTDRDMQMSSGMRRRLLKLVES